MLITQATSGKRIRDVRRTLRVSALDLFVSGLLGLFSCRWSHQNKRGQQIAEYMILIAGLAAAFTAMSYYAKRGLQANVKQLVDSEIGSQRGSNPLTSAQINQTSTAQSDSRSSGGVHMRKNGLATIYEIEMSASSSGLSTTVAEKIE